MIYNAEYDLRLIQQSLRPYNIEFSFPINVHNQRPIFTTGGLVHCAMLWYSQWIGEWNDYHQDYRWQKLPGGDHSALGDCTATLSIIQKMSKSHQSACGNYFDYVDTDYDNIPFKQSVSSKALHDDVISLDTQCPRAGFEFYKF